MGGRAGQGRTGCKAGQGRAGQGRARYNDRARYLRQGRAGQRRAESKAGQDRASRATQGVKGRAGQGLGCKIKSGAPYLIQGSEIVVDCLPVLGVEQEPAQHLRMVLCNDVPDGEEVAQTL